MICPRRSFMASALAGASFIGTAADVNPLVAERWRTRPLVIVVPAVNDPLLARIDAALRNDAVRAAFLEREMVLYQVVGGLGSRDGQPLSAVQTRALLDAVGVSAGSAPTGVLVGKDGTVKVREQGSVDLDALFATIDQMPMRRR